MKEWLDEFYGSDVTRRALEDSIAPVINDLGTSMAAIAASEVGVGEPAVGAFIQEMASTYIDNYLSSSKAQLTELLDAPDPKAAIQQRVGEWLETRPGKVAYEATYKTANAVTQTVYKDAGITKKKWNSTGKSCPYCQRMDGKIVGIEKPFHEAGSALDVPDSEFAALKAKLNFTHEIGHPPQHAGCDCVIEPESDFDEGLIGKFSQYSSGQIQSTLDNPKIKKDLIPVFKEILRRREAVPRATVEFAKSVWGSSKNSPFFKNLTPAQMDALSRYSGKDFVQFNGYYRKLAAGQTPRLTKALAARLQALQEAIDLQALPATVRVQRATTVSAFNRYHPREFIGKTITEPGFLSTSTKSLESFAGWDHAVKFNITAPAGTRAVYMEPITQAKTEQEILFGRGTTLRIDAVREVHTGATALRPARTIYEVDATIIPSKP